MTLTKDFCDLAMGSCSNVELVDGTNHTFRCKGTESTLSSMSLEDCPLVKESLTRASLEGFWKGVNSEIVKRDRHNRMVQVHDFVNDLTYDQLLQLRVYLHNTEEHRKEGHIELQALVKERLMKVFMDIDLEGDGP